MTTGHSLPNQGGTTKRMKPSSLTVMGGGEGFFYLRLLKKLPCSVLGRSTPETYCGSTSQGSRPPCGLAGETF